VYLSQSAQLPLETIGGSSHGISFACESRRSASFPSGSWVALQSESQRQIEAARQPFVSATMSAQQNNDHIKSLLKSRKYDEAYAECKEVLNRFPNSFEVNVYAGKCATELAQYDLVWSLSSLV
jgi:hypothetical protein